MPDKVSQVKNTLYIIEDKFEKYSRSVQGSVSDRGARVRRRYRFIIKAPIDVKREDRNYLQTKKFEEIRF